MTLNSCVPSSVGLVKTSELAVTSVVRTPLYINNPMVGKSFTNGFKCVVRVSIWASVLVREPFVELLVLFMFLCYGLFWDDVF